MKNSFFKFYLFFILVTISFLYLSLYVIDPLGANFRFNIKHINEIKPVAPEFSRKIKPYRIKAVAARTLILGNSRVAYGVNPEDLKNFPFPVYNAAIEFGQPFESLKILEYAVCNAPIEKVILFLDYITFKNENGVKDFKIDMWGDDLFSALNLNFLAYLSKESLLGAFKTIFYNLIRPLKGTTQFGYIYYFEKNPFQNIPKEERISRMEEECNTVLDDFSNGMKYVRKIVTICKEKNIELYTILGPFPPEHIAIRKQNGSWGEIKRWKDELKNYVDYLDYYLEESPFGNDYFYDRVHFTREAGKRMLNSNYFY